MSRWICLSHLLRAHVRIVFDPLCVLGIFEQTSHTESETSRSPVSTGSSEFVFGFCAYAQGLGWKHNTLLWPFLKHLAREQKPRMIAMASLPLSPNTSVDSTLEGGGALLHAALLGQAAKSSPKKIHSNRCRNFIDFNRRKPQNRAKCDFFVLFFFCGFVCNSQLKPHLSGATQLTGSQCETSGAHPRKAQLSHMATLKRSSLLQGTFLLCHLSGPFSVLPAKQPVVLTQDPGPKCLPLTLPLASALNVCP